MSPFLLPPSSSTRSSHTRICYIRSLCRLNLIYPLTSPFAYTIPRSSRPSCSKRTSRWGATHSLIPGYFAGVCMGNPFSRPVHRVPSYKHTTLLSHSCILTVPHVYPSPDFKAQRAHAAAGGFRSPVRDVVDTYLPPQRGGAQVSATLVCARCAALRCVAYVCVRALARAPPRGAMHRAAHGRCL